MDLEKLEKIALSLKKELQSTLREGFKIHTSDVQYAKIENLINLCLDTLPEHQTFVETSWGKWNSTMNQYNDDVIPILDYILELLEYEKRTESKITERKIFEGADEKMKQASLSFDKGDYVAVINNLNTALELMLKDKLEIPTTLSKINTSTIIDICVANKIGNLQGYFSEAKKHICQIDNKIKHTGYSPSKIDCINAIKSMEDLESKLKDKELELDKDLRNKIYEGI